MNRSSGYTFTPSFTAKPGYHIIIPRNMQDFQNKPPVDVSKSLSSIPDFIFTHHLRCGSYFVLRIVHPFKYKTISCIKRGISVRGSLNRISRFLLPDIQFFSHSVNTVSFCPDVNDKMAIQIPVIGITLKIGKQELDALYKYNREV